jgi:transcriptional regulator with XRE-family HTH domain
MPRSLRTAIQKRFQELLISARRAKKMTQWDVAKKLGRPQSFVAKYEGGERRLDVPEFIEVAKALGTDPCALLAKLLGT